MEPEQQTDPDDTTDYSAFESLTGFNLDHPDHLARAMTKLELFRLHSPRRKELVLNRLLVSDLSWRMSKPKPVFVVITQRQEYDSNGLLFQVPRDYYLLYYEVGPKDDYIPLAGADVQVVDHLRQASIDGLFPLDVIYVSAHGSQHGLHFDRYARGNTPMVLHTEDIPDWLAHENLDRLVTRGGHLILSSCLTGHGKQSHPNLAHRLHAEVFKGALTVWSNAEMGNKMTPHFKDGLFLNATLTWGDLYVIPDGHPCVAEPPVGAGNPCG